MKYGDFTVRCIWAAIASCLIYLFAGLAGYGSMVALVALSVLCSTAFGLIWSDGGVLPSMLLGVFVGIFFIILGGAPNLQEMWVGAGFASALVGLVSVCGCAMGAFLRRRFCRMRIVKGETVPER